MRRDVDLKTVKKLLKKYKTVEAVAKKLKARKQLIYERLRFDQLSEEIKKAVYEDLLSRAAALALYRMAHREQLRYLKLAKKQWKIPYVRYRHNGAVTLKEMRKIIREHEDAIKKTNKKS